MFPFFNVSQVIFLSRCYPLTHIYNSQHPQGLWMISTSTHTDTKWTSTHTHTHTLTFCWLFPLCPFKEDYRSHENTGNYLQNGTGFRFQPSWGCTGKKGEIKVIQNQWAVREAADISLSSGFQSDELNYSAVFPDCQEFRNPFNCDGLGGHNSVSVTTQGTKTFQMALLSFSKL